MISPTGTENIITPTEMLSKIGLLTMSNDFLSTQVSGYSQYITTLRKNIADEILKLEAEISTSEGVVTVKDAIDRIKAKLG